MPSQNTQSESDAAKKEAEQKAAEQKAAEEQKEAERKAAEEEQRKADEQKKSRKSGAKVDEDYSPHNDPDVPSSAVAEQIARELRDGRTSKTLASIREQKKAAEKK